jgi:hypothetical protein
LMHVGCGINVGMPGTRDDDRLDAQDPTRRRLLPLWPNLVVSRARHVYVVDLRQRFEGTDFVETNHEMSRWRGVDAVVHRFELCRSRARIVDELQKIIRDALGGLEEVIEIASRDGDLFRLADFDERLAGMWNERVDIDDPSGRCEKIDLADLLRFCF